MTLEFWKWHAKIGQLATLRYHATQKENLEDQAIKSTNDKTGSNLLTGDFQYSRKRVRPLHSG